MSDKLVGRVPVNKTASLVMGKGISYVPDKKIVNIHSENPLPLVKIQNREKDLTGVRFGFLTVVGKHMSGKKGALWSCRCVCGRYTARRSRSINNENNNTDCCEECRQLQFLKNRGKK